MNTAERSSHFWIGWGGSIALHVLILGLAGFLWVRESRLQMVSGEPTIDLDFSAAKSEPAPQPITPPVPEKKEKIPAPESAPSEMTQFKKEQKPMAQPVPKSVPPPAGLSGSRVAASPDENHNRPPKYPEESVAAHEEGVVMVRVEVDASGHVTAVSLAKSSGFHRLDQAALRAVKEWRFFPETLAGIPVSSVKNQPVRFKLE